MVAEQGRRELTCPWSRCPGRCRDCDRWRITWPDSHGDSHCFGRFLVRRNCCSQSSLNPAACQVPRGPARAWLVPDSAKSLRREFYQVASRWVSENCGKPAQETINSRDERQARQRTGRGSRCAVSAELSRMLAPPLRSLDPGVKCRMGPWKTRSAMNLDGIGLRRRRRNGRGQSHRRAGR